MIHRRRSTNFMKIIVGSRFPTFLAVEPKSCLPWLGERGAGRLPDELMLLSSICSVGSERAHSFNVYCKGFRETFSRPVGEDGLWTRSSRGNERRAVVCLEEIQNKDGSVFSCVGVHVCVRACVCVFKCICIY